MKIRKNIFPRRVADVFCFLLIGVFLPVVFFFEMTVVLPAIHQSGGFFHTFTFLIATFLFFNITTNMLACMLVDTSVEFDKLKVPYKPDEAGWRYCEICKQWAPPRSWHCKICRSCILKRDHHCLFTACCVGHRNHRYFMMFVVFLFIGSTYAFVYNSLYLWVFNANKYANLLSLLKIFCPAIYLITGSIWHDNNLYLIYYSLNILALCYSVLLVGYHVPIILKGGVCHERGKGYPYNGDWKQNLRGVLGKRMHLTWLSPFVRSELPGDGVTWSRQNEIQNEKNK